MYIEAKAKFVTLSLVFQATTHRQTGTEKIKLKLSLTEVTFTVYYF